MRLKRPNGGPILDKFVYRYFFRPGKWCCHSDFNHLFSRKKLAAEVRKINAETEKIIAENTKVEFA